MKATYLILLTLCANLTNCMNAGHNKETSDPDSLERNQNWSTDYSKEKSAAVEMQCDSIFGDKGIEIKLISLDSIEASEPEYRFVFLVNKQNNGHFSEIFRDTIESSVQEIKFIDFNNDHIKDILIQNSSDVRSNWTYNLYIVGGDTNSIRKIKGFEEIKNPNYLPHYDLVDNMVMSGRNWTSFYKIVGDTVKDFNIVIYDGEDEHGNYSYDAEYQKALNKITKHDKGWQ